MGAVNALRFETGPPKIVPSLRERRWQRQVECTEERDAANVFSFYEGPPTVNGTPGIHHVFSRTLKDVICRYKTMRGFRVERKAGWDTHGLPVEIAVEKDRIVLTQASKPKYEARIIEDPVTGFPVLYAGPDAPVLTSEMVRELLTDFP